MLTTKHSLCGTESKYLLEQFIALPSVGKVYKNLWQGVMSISKNIYISGCVKIMAGKKPL